MTTIDLHNELQACLALRHTPGLGAKTWKRLVEAFGSAHAAMVGVRSWPSRGYA